MPRRAPRFRLPDTTVAAGVSFAILLATYLATAAPDLTFWDASEFVTAAHTFGIPHPPGTPLWVLLANVCTKLFSSAGPVRSVTLLSVWTTALACALGAAMAARWIGSRGAVAAAVSAGTMFTVWGNATETEVYAASLLLSVCMLYAGERAGRSLVTDDERQLWRMIIALCAGFAIPLHLSALVALPAAVMLAWNGRVPTLRQVSVLALVATLGLSAVFIMLVRAKHDPVLNSGNPDTIRGLLDVLQRKQYAVPGLWPRRAPLWLQLGNVFQWADWQVAFGAAPTVGPSWRRTPLTILWAWLGILGTIALWRHDKRVGRAVVVLLLSGFVGVALWLNLRAGPSYGAGVLPANALHEARERDYFFALGFWSWGLLAGVGIASVAQTLAKRIPRPATVAVLLFAAIPLFANRSSADRTHEPESMLPRLFARLLLDEVPRNGVLVVGGDNDTFPAWYLQYVEGYRDDVGIVSAPLLGARWYREELAVRRLLPATHAAEWRGTAETLRAVGELAESSNRHLRVSVVLDADERRMLQSSKGWLLHGLVYAPTGDVEQGRTGLDLAALRRSQQSIPQSALDSLKGGHDRIVHIMQAHLRCAGISSLQDTLLVGRCNGG